MKYLTAFILALVPLAASASYGPVNSEAASENRHLVELAWVSTSGEITPGCTDPTPQPQVFACAVMAPIGK